MTEPIFISSPVSVLRGDAARVALETTNDAAHYIEGKGVLSVPLERWEAAQAYERETWLTHGLMLTEDRNAEHAVMFNGYKALPNDIGVACEVGCGPFTNLKHILPSHEYRFVNLLDPLASDYQRDHPHCSYRDGNLCGKKADILPLSIEQCYDFDQEYIGYAVNEFKYDTLVMINVLPHCQDVTKVFWWIDDHLKTGGHLVFHEPARDIDPVQVFDVGHPLSYTQAVIEDFLTGYEQVYRNGDYFIGVKK